MAQALAACRQARSQAAIGRCVERWERIDILHNNIGTEIMGNVVEVTEQDWDRAFAINLRTVFLAMKHAIPIMAAGGGGSIINISSVTALRHVGVAYASYYASKAALCHLTRTTAIDFASQGVRVNAILPGMLRTPHVEHNPELAHAFGSRGLPTAEETEAMWRRRDARIPLGRTGDAWDVAWAAVFLASDEARYVTGAELVIDGGMSLRVP